MPTGSCPAALQLIEHRDRIGDTGVDRVDRIDQQGAVVRIQLGVGTKRLQFAATKSHEHLHHRVGVCSLRVDAENVRQTHVGREIAAADQRGAAAVICPPQGTAPQPELEHRATAPGLPDSAGFRGNQRRVVEMIEQRRFENLSHRQRTLYDGHRRVGMDHSPLGHGKHLELRKISIRLEPLEELRSEPGSARSIGLGGNHVEVCCGECDRRHPIQERLEAGRDAVARLVPPVVRIATEEHVELGGPLVQAVLEVELGHGELVLIGEEDPLGISWEVVHVPHARAPGRSTGAMHMRSPPRRQVPDREARSRRTGAGRRTLRRRGQCSSRRS